MAMTTPDGTMDRFACLQCLASHAQDELVVLTSLGATCPEWMALTSEHARNAPLGHMGSVLGLAIGLALALPHQKVLCIDADGSALLELGQLVALGQHRPPNLTVVVVDNACYESLGSRDTGYRPSATAGSADLAAIARACGVARACTVRDLATFEEIIQQELATSETSFVVARVAPAPLRVPPRQQDAVEDKYRFVRYVERLEGIRILHPPKTAEQPAKS